jgi:hypothetical protein
MLGEVQGGVGGRIFPGATPKTKQSAAQEEQGEKIGKDVR